jgi:outer membrane protein assembly factor BamB
MPGFRLFSLPVFLLLLAVQAPAADWPQFRGPHSSGVSTETGLPLEWSASRNVVWKAPLPGPGSSSPIVFGDHVYVTCYSGYGLDRKSPGAIAQLKRHLVCLSRTTGEASWTRTIAPEGSDQPYERDNIALHGYASHTPVADQTGVYAYFGSTGAVAFSHSGEENWRVSCGKKFHVYGSAASPILHGDLLIVDAFIETAEEYRQGDLIALDKRTGREVWRQKAGAEWSSPILVEVGAKTELAVGTLYPGPFVGLEPETGKRLWECKAAVACGTPVANKGVIYIVADDQGKTAIRAGGRGDVTRSHELWQSPGGTRIPSPVYHDGHLYWSREDGGAVFCAEASTGKTVYRARLANCGRIFASPVVADGRIYYVSREDGTFVLAARPEFKLLARNRLEGDDTPFNGSPAVSGGCLFLRSDKFLYSIGKRQGG